MKYLALFGFLTLGFFISAQELDYNTYIQEIENNRSEHLIALQDTSHGYLNLEEIEHFKGLDYFPVDTAFRITATFEKNKGKKFQMPTSTDRLPWYRRYGYIVFTIDGEEYKLAAYKNIVLSSQKEYRKYLFIPFRDATSRNETYGGGRFMDTEIPNGSTIIIDFNTAYNPYCAYSYRYSCPIPPAENTLTVKINAGEKTPLGH